MKVSPKLLQAMVVAATVGITASSCEKLDLQKEMKSKGKAGIENQEHGNNGTSDPCPACGMG